LNAVVLVGLLAVLRLRGPLWAAGALILYLAIRLSISEWQRRRADWRSPRPPR
jgi:hypothetical protein